MATLTKASPREATSTTNGARGYISPVVDIVETKEGYLLEAEMPGVNKEGLDVTLEGNELTIIGRRSLEEARGEPVHRESSFRDYRRVFLLDPEVDTSKIQAQMDQGVLKLTLPKTEKVKPRKVNIK